MNIKSLWNDQIPERDGVPSAINDVAISPDGSKLIAAVGNRVLLYKTENGDLVESLRGHKDTVYSVSFSSDGSRFASGGADNIVVIWKSSGQGLLKYNHTAPIQRVVYNPNMLLLASCSDVDFGLWTPDQKQVTKEKLPSRIVSTAWNTDGTILAVGCMNGLVSLRNQQADEIMKFERKAPVWCLSFIPDLNPVKQVNNGIGNSGATVSQTPSGAADNRDLLVVGCWDKTISLYKILASNVKLHTEKPLKYYPCSMAYSTNHITKASYLVLSGSSNKVTLHSREGAKLTDLHKKDAWVWGVAAHGDSDTLALGTHTGALDFMQLNLDSVNALYKDRYAYRENLTEVIVHHLVTDKKVRIKCKDLIRNLSLYKNKLAVQLSDRVCVYESSADDYVDMHFKLRREKIMTRDSREMEPDAEHLHNLMAITAAHLLFCNKNILELYSFDGQRQKVWKLDSDALYMRVDGGPEGREGVLLGLSSGAILRVYVDNPFPLELTKRAKPIIHLDINIYRTILASVDSDHMFLVTDLRTQETLFSCPGIISAYFNTEVEDLLCITGEDQSISVISGVKNATANAAAINASLEGLGAGAAAAAVGRVGLTRAPELQEQHIFGSALGFRGQKIFCLQRAGMVGVDVPQGTNMLRALDQGDFVAAYRIACLGATEADWKVLAMKALRANHLTIAKYSFARLKDTKFLSLIDNIERRGGVASSAAEAPSKKIAPTAPIGTGTGRYRSSAAAAAAEKSAPVPKGKEKESQQLAPLDPTWLAEITAYEGHHQEAAKIYARNGQMNEAIRLFTDLRRWEDAKMFARNAGQGADLISSLTIQQANWLQEINDWKAASDLFSSLGQFLTAAKIIGDNEDQGWTEALLEVVRACPADNQETLEYCGVKFSQLEDISYAQETFKKAKDISKLMSLYAKRQMWNEAAKLADEHEGQFDVSIFLSYAEWLVSQDRYEDAMQAFKKSNRLDLANKLLQELTNNAVAECRFKDAAYYYWMLSKEIEPEISALGLEEGVTAKNETKGESKKDVSSAQQQAHELALRQVAFEHKADLYYAYASVHAFVTDPFTAHQPDMLFQVSRFIINSLGSSDSVPNGVSKSATLYTLARQAMQLGAYKLARHAYDRLSKLRITDAKRLEEVEIDMLLVQAKPVRDDPDQLPVCYRCSSTNPLLNPFTNKFAKGDVCTNCGHPFVRSFINFDILPLVEFVPEPEISDEEAIDLIRQPTPSKASMKLSMAARGGDASLVRYGEGKNKGGGWKESKEGGGADVMTLQQDDDDFGSRGYGGRSNRASRMNDDDMDESDQFTKCLNHTLEQQKSSYTPVQVDANTLLTMRRSDVFVCRPSSKAKRATFYRNMLPEIPIAISQPCHRFFHLEDFEFAYLSGQKCPYSRLRNVGEYGSL